ncbi:MAG TPA: type VII secretion target [Lentzea sp.]
MSGGFQVQSEAISAHGKQLVGQLAPSLQEAVSASQVSLGPNVMGELCQHWSWIFNEELDDAKALLAALPKAFESTGDELCSTAETYQQVEEGNRAAMQGMDR